jgi:acylphosphatase
MQRAHIIIHGLVQGVFFRHNTKKLALDLVLKGFARNNEDGTVEIIAQGHDDKIKELIEFCKTGPKSAKVSKINVKFENPKNDFNSFEVI